MSETETLVYSESKVTSVLVWFVFSFGCVTFARLVGAAGYHLVPYLIYFAFLGGFAILASAEPQYPFFHMTVSLWVLFVLLRYTWVLGEGGSPIPFVGDVSYGLILVLIREPRE